MYFKRILLQHTEYHATNSAGNHVASIRKLENGLWGVLNKKDEMIYGNHPLEDCFDYVCDSMFADSDQKQRKKAKTKA